MKGNISSHAYLGMAVGMKSPPGRIICPLILTITWFPHNEKWGSLHTKFLTSWYFSFSSIHYSCCLVTKSCLILLRSRGLYITCQAPLSKELSRQEYWHGLPFPSLGALPDSGIKFGFPAWRVGSTPLSHQGIPPL